MRWLYVGLVLLALAGCSKAPEGNMPGETVTSASGVAFAYRYGLRLPSAGIADALETQAQACEQLSPARCRITGMDYRLDGSGQATASLDVQVSSSVARSFGHQAVKRVEAAGGALAGAEITGTDGLAATEAAQTAQKDAGVDRSAIDRQLARTDLSADARRDLLTRRAELLRAQREGEAAATAAQASLSTTPIHFDYATGTGVGLKAQLAEAAHTAYASLTWTLVTLLTLLAYLGPPLLLLLLLALLWHRFGQHWWTRLFGEPQAE
jgi:hypothetical protein